MRGSTMPPLSQKNINHTTLESNSTRKQHSVLFAGLKGADNGVGCFPLLLHRQQSKKAQGWSVGRERRKSSTAESQGRGMQELWRTYGQEKKLGNGICSIGKVQDSHLHVLGLFSCRVSTLFSVTQDLQQALGSRPSSCTCEHEGTVVTLHP